MDENRLKMVSATGLLLAFLAALGTLGVLDPLLPNGGRESSGKVLGEHRYTVHCLAFGPDGKLLAAGGGYPGREGEVRLWDLSRNTLRAIFSGHRTIVYAIAFAPNGKLLTTASYDGVMKLWDVASTRESATVLIDGQATGVRLAVAAGGPAGTLIACAPGGAVPGCERYRVGDVMLWRMVAGTGPSPEERSVRVALGSDGHRFALCRLDLGPKTIEKSQGRNIFDLACALKDVPGVDIWSASIGHERFRLGHRDAHIYALDFSPDGQRLASAGADETVRLWDTTTGRERMTLRGHTAQVNSVAFATNGKLLASGSHDRTVRVWDVARGSEHGVFCGHVGAVTCVAFSPDGQLVASGSYDKTVRLWPLTVDPSIK